MKIVALSLACILWLLAGCSSVTSLQPLGREPVTDPGFKLEGAWVGLDVEEDDHLFLIKDLGAGRMRLAGLDWVEGDFQIKDLSSGFSEGLLRRSGETWYLNMEGKEAVPADAGAGTAASEKSIGYMFFLFRPQPDGTIEVLLPRVESFAKWVEQGDLKGVTERQKYSTTVKLEGDPRAIEAFIARQQPAQVWEMDKPPLRVKRVGHFK